MVNRNSHNRGWSFTWPVSDFTWIGLHGHTPDCIALLIFRKVVSDPDEHKKLEDYYFGGYTRKTPFRTCFIRVVFVLFLGMNFGQCGAG